MQILSLPPSLPLSDVLLFFTLQTKYCIDPLKTEEGFLTPPVSSPCVVFGSVPTRPMPGAHGPPFPFPQLGVLQLPQESSAQGSRLCPPSPPPPAPFLINGLHFSLSLPCHIFSPSPKSLRFSFLKCGLKIIFGKLTAPLPPVSTHIREEKSSLKLSWKPPKQGAANL